MRNLTLFLIFILTLGTLVAWTALAPFLSSKPSDEDPLAHDLNPVIEKADAFFEKRWKDLDFEPATRAEDLQIYRRISLA